MKAWMLAAALAMRAAVGWDRNRNVPSGRVQVWVAISSALVARDGSGRM